MAFFSFCNGTWERSKKEEVGGGEEKERKVVREKGGRDCRL